MDRARIDCTKFTTMDAREACMEMAPLLAAMGVLGRLLNKFYIDPTRPLERAREKLAACPATARIAEIVERAISALAERKEEA
ncbi:MAG: hypothetical protein RXR06_11760, partial [Thermoproteus sp.]